MRTTVLLIAALLLLAPAVAAQGGKQEALAKVEALFEEGDLDTAKQLIDFLLEKNPGDPDLLRLLDGWHVLRGDLGPLLAGEDLERDPAKLRAACARVVRATMRGNPEEWVVLRDAFPEEEVRALLAPIAGSGSPEDRRIAAEMLDPPAPASEPGADALVAMVRDGRDGAIEAFFAAEGAAGVKALAPYARKVWDGAGDDFELRHAAGRLLLASGSEKPRETLLAALRSERAIEAVSATRVLARHPGPGPAPLQALCHRIRNDEEILGRLKPILLAEVLAALGRAPGEKGAREFLEARLDDPVLRTDAARALGALGDAAAVPALLGYLRTKPSEDEEDAAGGGLGFLGGAGGGARAEAAAADALHPTLVGALAILRLTR